MMISHDVEIRDVEFFRQLRRQNLGIGPPNAIGAALKAIAAPPPSNRDRSIAVGKYVAGPGVAVSCSTRKFEGGPPPAPTVPLAGTVVGPEIDAVDVAFLYDPAVSPDLRRQLIEAVRTRPSDPSSTSYVNWSDSLAGLRAAIDALVDREGAPAVGLYRLLFGPDWSATKWAAAAQPRDQPTTLSDLQKIVTASRERRGAHQAHVIEKAMRQHGLTVTRTPAGVIKMVKMFEVSDDGRGRYPDQQSVKILIRSAIGEPDASVFLNWIDALDRMPIRKAAIERNGAAFQGLLKRIDRHPVTPAQAGLIRRALMGGY